MCGICGELRFDGEPVPTSRLIAMADQLAHRGPDSDGVYVSASGSGGLAFRRLRIIDLSPNANQPLANEDGSIQVVFNGEIYNFRQLRADLVSRGHVFRSHSDTETIVHLYEEKGPACVADLDGMFAIGIWDDGARRLTLARDRAGKKPLFYYQSPRFLAFASEMKSFFAHPQIPMEVDPQAIPYYFINGYVSGPETFYAQVRQLEPGTVMTVDACGAASTHRYWQIDFPQQVEVAKVPRPEAAAAVRRLLTQAVERRLISDVPLGAFLSGGLDSTIVVGIMSGLMREPVKTFSIGFERDAAYDETSYARIAAQRFKTNHTEFRVAPSAVDLIDTLVWHHDGPFGDSSAVPTYIVSKLARAHVTVALTGDGGDELFAGYRRFQAGLWSERIPRWAAASGLFALAAGGAIGHERGWRAEARRFLRGIGRPLDERMTMWNALFFEDLDALLRREFVATLRPIDRLHHLRRMPDMAGRSTLSRLLGANFTSYLADDLLVKTDRCTMATSLEARSPFLDRELIDYVARLPDRMKIAGGRTKAILRDACRDLIPPEINARGKMGFGVPVGAWFRGELCGYMTDLLLAPAARYREFLSGSFVERLVNGHVAGTVNAGQQLWSLICFERWLQLLPEWRQGRRPPSERQPAVMGLAAARR